MAEVDPEEARRRAEAALESLKSIEPQYFVDYCSFSGKLREYVSHTLSEAFARDPNSIRRPYHLVSAITQKYAAYEDAAAMLKAFLEFRAGMVAIPLITLMRYGVGEARLDTVFKAHSIETDDDLLTKLRLMEWAPADWTQWFPEIDLEKAVRLACLGLVKDFRTDHKPGAISAYNKIKHGLIVIPSATKYKGPLPDCPAAIYSTKQVPGQPEEEPFTLYAFGMDDANIKRHEMAVYYVQVVLRLVAAFYLHATYPDKVRQVWGGGKAMFRSPAFHDVLGFMRQVTIKDQGTST